MKKIVLLFALCFTIVITQARTWYVSQGATGNGMLSTTPSGDLQNIINQSAAGDYIYVSRGEYKPNRPANNLSSIQPNNRDNAFVLTIGTTVSGGWSPDFSVCDPQAYTTILSGDIGTIGNNSDNCYHVVIVENHPYNGRTYLKGVTIKNGNANGRGGVTMADGSITPRDHGGGIYMSYTCLSLQDVRIIDNFAAFRGGGMYADWNFEYKLIIKNSYIKNNKSNSHGGGLYLYGILADIINTEISNNEASTGHGGGFSLNYTSLIIRNVTIAKNKANNCGGIYTEETVGHESTIVLQNTIIAQNTASIASTHETNSSLAQFDIWYSYIHNKNLSHQNNIRSTANPVFIDADNQNYRLPANSSLINKGNNAYWTNLELRFAEDASGNPRIYNSTIDIGAYEYNPNYPNVPVWYVKSGGSGSKNGTSWANASNDIQAMINIASPGNEIWVAAGTYSPTRSADNYTSSSPILSADNAFVLRPNVKVYGGFAGSETLLSQRNVTTNTTILSGLIRPRITIGNISIPELRAYHVVISARHVWNACLDGFTITGGEARGSGSIMVNNIEIRRDCGGGIILEWNSSPTLKNLIIKNNSADWGGGLYTSVYSSPLIDNLIIENNTATHGGGICSHQSYDINWSNLLIRNNKSNNGGGIHMNNSSGKIQNVLIADNEATAYGGGVFTLNFGGDIINATITKNKAANGGAIAEMTSAQMPGVSFFKNSIVHNNNTTSGQYPNVYAILNSQLSYDYSLIQGISVAGLSSPTINIHVNMDPMLTSDYKLRYEIVNVSPCIGIGNNSYNTTAKDLAGNTRKVGTIDLGAYETINAPYPAPPVPNNPDILENHLSGSNFELNLNVFPNPSVAGERITVSLDDYNNPVDVEIYSIEGKLMHNKTYEGGSFNLDIPELPSGIYMINVKIREGNVFTKKIILNQ